MRVSNLSTFAKDFSRKIFVCEPSSSTVSLPSPTVPAILCCEVFDRSTFSRFTYSGKSHLNFPCDVEAMICADKSSTTSNKDICHRFVSHDLFRMVPYRTNSNIEPLCLDRTICTLKKSRGNGSLLTGNVIVAGPHTAGEGYLRHSRTLSHV